MSHSIIFDSKVVRLSDGRLLHLERSGCNNDTSGRSLSEYTGKIYTHAEFQKHVLSFTRREKSEHWELKWRYKPITLYDYGRNLARLANAAKTFQEFSSERYFYGNRHDGVKMYQPEEKTLTIEEFDKCCYEYMRSNKPFQYRVLTTRLNTEAEIISNINGGKSVCFYVGTKNKIKSA